MCILLALSATICMFIFRIYVFHVLCDIHDQLKKLWTCVCVCDLFGLVLCFLRPLLHMCIFFAYRENLQMSRLRQSWASTGILHFQNSSRNRTTWSAVRKDQAQARFQEQSWKAIQKEMAHQRESEATTHQKQEKPRNPNAKHIKENKSRIT